MKKKEPSLWKHPILIILYITIFSTSIFLLVSYFPFTSKHIKTAQKNYTSEHFTFELIKIITIFISLYVSIQSITEKEYFRRDFQISGKPVIDVYGETWGKTEYNFIGKQDAIQQCQNVANNPIACHVIAGCKSRKPVIDATCIYQNPSTQLCYAFNCIQ